MSSNNPENFSEGDWEEKGDLAWNEHDWQQYLNRNDKEVTRFISFYKKFKGQVNSLDDIATIMGWDQDEWTVSLEMPIDLNEEKTSWDKEDPVFDEEEPEIEDNDPYTVHRHPVCIVTRGLYRYLYEEWEVLILEEGLDVTPAQAYKIPQSFRDAEFHALMGIFAVDMGDYNLCVSHLKNALCSLNKSLNLMQQMTDAQSEQAREFVDLTQAVLFDLRELWLRIMRECREEFRRGYRG